ncbi:hypothetical protein [Dishui Lake phycodnavirus 3]|nr:hypothetical protein [Dishui Lake phycodnavirus 3]
MIDIESLAREIYSQLGPGFSERVYHNAMEVLLRKHNVPYESERIVPILFEGHTIGNLRADIIINNEYVLEFKTIKCLNDAAEYQARNYLRLTNLSKAFLINFGYQDLEIRAIVVQPSTEIV